MRTIFRHPVTAIVLLVVAVVLPFVQDDTAQSAARFALTGAVVDDGTIRLDGYADVLGMDVARRDGHLYSDKAPGQPLLVAPVYAAARAVGAEPASVLRVEENLTLWWLVVWTSLVPLLVLIGLLWRLGREVDWVPPRARMAALTVFVLGSPLLPFAAELYAHLLVATIGFGAWLAIRRCPERVDRAALAGLLIGVGVAIEYPTAIVGVAVAALLVARRQWRSLAAFSGAGLLFLPPLLWYHSLAFGGPFRTGYSDKELHAGSQVVTGLPDPGTLVSSLLGRRGLLVWSPVLILALFGLVRLVRERTPLRLEAVVGAAVFGAFLLLQAGMPDPWGGDNHGPRYALAALPFLAVGLFDAWPRFELRRIFAAFSIAAMSIVLVAYSLIAMDRVSVLTHLESIVDDGPEATLFTMALGGPGWIVHALAVAGALAWWRQVHRRLDGAGVAEPASIAAGVP